MAPVTAAAPAPDPASPASQHIDALVAGYREKIAGRSRGPIRDWLQENNGFTLQAGDGDSLVRSEQGLIAAIPIDDQRALLVPSAGFVVDFATQYAPNQLGLKQVMRNVFEPVADRGGDMKLLAPAIARRQGEEWLLERPGRLGGFTDG